MLDVPLIKAGRNLSSWLTVGVGDWLLETPGASSPSGLRGVCLVLVAPRLLGTNFPASASIFKAHPSA